MGESDRSGVKEWHVHFCTEHHGYVTVEGATPKEALEAFKEWHIDDYSKFSDPRRTRVYEITDIHGENGTEVLGMEWEE